jgi:hypothetical protein
MTLFLIREELRKSIHGTVKVRKRTERGIEGPREGPERQKIRVASKEFGT